MAHRNKLKRGNPAPDLSVINADGAEIALSSMWADKPLVLTFLRHFG